MVITSILPQGGVRIHREDPNLYGLVPKKES
jgi:hypothetical protein